MLSFQLLLGREFLINSETKLALNVFKIPFELKAIAEQKVCGDVSKVKQASLHILPR